MASAPGDLEKAEARTDYPNSNQTTENSATMDVDVKKSENAARLTKIFITSCVLGVFLDPLFLYIPLLNHDLKCLRLDNTIKIIALVSRLFTDLFYVGRIILQVCRFENCSPFINRILPESCSSKLITSLIKCFRELLPEVTEVHEKEYLIPSITKEIRESSIIVDILAILPLPQVAILIFFPKMRVSGSFGKRIMNFLVMVQYVPRVLRIYLSCKKARKPFKGHIPLWLKGLLNLFLYILASNVLGAFWYFFAAQQMISCWEHACGYGNGCGATTFNCHDHQTSRNITVLNNLCPIDPPNATLFDFGIYLNVLQSGALWSTDYPLKFLNSFCWGLRNLSSLASNLQPSFYTWEIAFVAFISIIGLILFVYLIGNLQTYVLIDTQSLESHRRENKLKRKMKENDRKVEQWLSGHGIPLSRKQKIMEEIHRELVEHSEFDVVREILSILPHEDIKSCSPLSRLRKVPLLKDMDEGVLVEISEKLHPEKYTSGQIIIKKDETLQMMLFIVDGHVNSDAGSLRILVIGAGGREHALVDALEPSPLVDQIFVAPGNGGTGNGKKTVNVNIQATDFDALVAFAKSASINLVVPGPEQPLVDGVEAVFRAAGIKVFGPSAKAAAMEGSKTFSKAFMQRHHIPTARYRNCSDIDSARQYLDSVDHNVVIKASGLAAGKGVIIPQNKEEAHKALDDIMVRKEFGHAGDEVVIEEFLQGQELSILALSDGYTVLALPAAQDHKRIGDGDTGPNTGGMGTYAPTPIYTAELKEQIHKTVLQPSIDGMRRDGFPFVGVLFVGLMITEDGPKCLEYNVRFGDPETQSVLALLKSDLAEIMLACVDHRLDAINLEIDDYASAVTVVLASGGYPGDYAKGIPITLGELPQGVKVFHAGTLYKDGQTLTAGGRVLAVTATGPTLQEAVALAYAGVAQISFEGMTYRKDIAHRALSIAPKTSPTRPKLPPPAVTQRFTYAAAGVSVDAGNALVETIKPAVKATMRPGADSELGGFGGLFDLKAAGYTDPILVSGTDGVGTKLIVAQSTGSHQTVGIDLVAMSVNDLLVQGAEPLFFLDYYACSKLDTATAADVIRGVALGCKQAGCALIGGETAEMPDLYQGDDYDLGGFAVGAVERSDVLPSPNRPVRAGDVLLGLSSTGPHSNGFSLIRKIVKNRGLAYNAPAPWVPKSGSHVTTVGEALLAPTRIYVAQILPVLRRYRGTSGGIKAMSHITGGGFIENIPRVLPKGLGAELDLSGWPLPGVFKWLMGDGNVEGKEMARTFNCGIGMVVVVGQEDVDKVQRELDAFAGENKAEVFRIGKVVEGAEVKLENLESWSKAAQRRTSGSF